MHVCMWFGVCEMWRAGDYRRGKRGKIVAMREMQGRHCKRWESLVLDGEVWLTVGRRGTWVETCRFELLNGIGTLESRF